MSDADTHSAEHRVTFSRTAWHERLQRFATFLPGQIPLFATVTVSFWGVAEVLAEIGGEALSLRNLAPPALATALVISIYRAIQRYRSYVPDALSHESHLAKQIYRGGKLGWQFALAKELLSRRLDSHDRTLRRIESGAQFIPPQHLPGPEYLTWLQRRPETLLRLLEAVAVQCTKDLPSALKNVRGESDLSALKDAVEQLAQLYQEATKFELELRGTVPPNTVRSIHRMTFGWSFPIRDGITKFTDILDRVSNIDVERIAAGQDQMPIFAIRFESPPNVEEFRNALKAAGPSAFR